MRIERLDLAPYGRFTDRRLTFSPSAALHVVLGANEAGKTTTLEAIGDLLFGFLDRTKYGFLHEQTLLRVGGALLFDDGERIEVVRRKGRQNTLLDPAGRPLSDEPLRRALGAVDRPTFAMEFGLTSPQLREGGRALLRAGGRLAESLAAGSASLSALSALQKRFDEEKDKLFSARRVESKDFYRALDRYAVAAKALKAAIVDGDEWKAAEGALEKAKLDGLEARDRVRALRDAVTRRKRALRVRGKLAALAETATRLEAMASLPEIPAATASRAHEALTAQAAAQAELDRLAAEDAEGARALSAISVNAKLIAQKAAVEALTRQIGAVENFERDLGRRLADEEEARLRLAEIARKLGLDGPDALLAAPPTEPELARARALTERAKRARDNRARAQKDRREAEATRDRLEANLAAAEDPAPLKRRLAAMSAILEEAKLYARDRAALTRETRALAEKAAALDPGVADLDALACAPLPGETELARRAEAEQGAEDGLRAAREKLGDARRLAAQRQQELGRIEAAGRSATRADWEAARGRREAALDRLAQALDGPAAARAEGFAAARALTEAADATAELVLDGADRAARLQAARDALAQANAEAQARETASAEAQAAWERESAATASLWSASGIAPGPSARRLPWRRAVADLIARREALKAREADLSAQGERIEAARATLARWLGEAGAAFDRQAPFEQMHIAASDRLEALNAVWLQARQVEIARVETDKTLAAAERALADLDAAETELRLDWPLAMARLGLRVEASPEEAEAALAAWSEVGVPREKLRAAADRIEKIRIGLDEFEREAAAAVAAAAPELAGAPGVHAAAELAARLAAAEKALSERERLTREAGARADRRAGIEASRLAFRERLAPLSEALGATDAAALEDALAQLAAGAELRQQRDALQRDIAEIGEGLDEAQLRAEQAEFDPTTLAAEIEDAEREQALLWDAFKSANEAEAAAQSRLDALAAGRNAAGAARERVEAAGELAETAESWLLKAAAAKLAARAIERHRAAAQDPLIARAGGFFALATGGSFVGLGVEFDDGDNPVLVGRRADGKVVRPDGLSEGALDQLFLSLRLALLERRAGEPLPFIGDDLLASFDDERARAALTLLAEFGARRQTILFTHHSRIAEIAIGLRSGIEVVEM